MRRTGTFWIYGFLAVCLAVATPVWAKSRVVKPTRGVAESSSYGTVAVAPSEAEAEAAYQAARQEYVSATEQPFQAAASTGVSGTVPGQAAADTLAGGKYPQNVAMEEISLVMDVDNVTLRQVMAEVVRQAAAYTGPWTVKWRLKPENMSILDEKVNLTAEAPFGEFCQLLTEKVKNMTGVQLFVTAFGGARVILVTDTYY